MTPEDTRPLGSLAHLSADELRDFLLAVRALRKVPAEHRILCLHAGMFWSLDRLIDEENEAAAKVPVDGCQCEACAGVRRLRGITGEESSKEKVVSWRRH